MHQGKTYEARDTNTDFNLRNYVFAPHVIDILER